MPDADRGTRSGGRWAITAALLSLAALVVGTAGTYPLSPDSWSFVELAHSLASDPYRVTTVREFQTGGQYSASFPPLWPALVALSLRLAGDSLVGPYLLTFIVYALFAAAAELFGRRLTGRRWIGLLSAVLLTALPGVRSELGGIRSIPLALLLTALLGSLLVRLRPRQPLEGLAVGVVVGLLVMTRFDSLPTAAVVVVGAPVMLGMRGAAIPAMVVGFLGSIAPWIAYSRATFGRWFATDNGGVALSIDPRAFVLDFHVTPPRTLFDDPGAWIAKVAGNVPRLAESLAEAGARSVFLPLVLALAVGALVWRRTRTGVPASAHERAEPRTHAIADERVARRGAALLALALAAPYAAYLATGYLQERYYAPALWLAELLALATVVRLAPRAAPAVVALLFAAGVAKSAGSLRLPEGRQPFVALARQQSTADVIETTACLRAAGGTERDMVAFWGTYEAIDPFRFGALSGWRTTIIPGNWSRLPPQDQLTFLRTLGVRFWFGARQPLPDGARLDRLPCRVPTWRLTLSG